MWTMLTTSQDGDQGKQSMGDTLMAGVEATGKGGAGGWYP